jgi:hypothetical protein
MYTLYAGSVPPYGDAFSNGAGLPDSVQGRAAIGVFWARNRQFMVVAASDSTAASSVRLVLRGVADVSERSAGPVPQIEERPDDVVVTLYFAPGDFALLEFTGWSGAGVQPGLALAPNPASSTVEFRLTDVVNAGLLTILDASGRRAWTSRLHSGSSRRTWRGELDNGGIARAGIYFARLEDGFGRTRTLRFAWLGP